MAEVEALRSGPASGGAPRQLVVLCHGYGADGHDLIDLSTAWAAAAPDALFVAPHASEPCADSPLGRQWFPLWDRTPTQLAVGVRSAAAALDAFLDAEIMRLGLPATHYALMGFSQGAMLVLHAGLRRPAAPRAILAFSGALLAPEALAQERANAAPVLLIHGDADPVVPVQASRQAEQVLLDAGVLVETLYRPGIGHAIDEAGIAAAALFLQRAFSMNMTER